VAAASKPIVSHADDILSAAEGSQDTLLTATARIQQALAAAEATQAGRESASRSSGDQDLRDPLTDCFTRESCLARLADLLAPPGASKRVALAPVAVEGLQEINRALGYAAGDKVLSVIGRLLRGHVEPIGQPCRYGGGNFVVLCPGATPEAAGPHLARFAGAVADFRFHKAGVRIPIAVRHAFCPVEPGATVESAIESAFRALLPSPP
jgi:diguanylate cyclase (GGDEF)-like protein